MILLYQPYLLARQRSKPIPDNWIGQYNFVIALQFGLTICFHLRPEDPKTRLPKRFQEENRTLTICRIFEKPQHQIENRKCRLLQKWQDASFPLKCFSCCFSCLGLDKYTVRLKG